MTPDFFACSVVFPSILKRHLTTFHSVLKPFYSFTTRMTISNQNIEVIDSTKLLGTIISKDY